MLFAGAPSCVRGPLSQGMPRLSVLMRAILYASLFS
jgi:hypothetical protein